eukprot:GHVP01025869.1.p2 GENE.GHVP01025869.1~~GHVP01025869.1.p2  ORF type:complete len:150 (-),score=40.44 GHVP01025869.1:691-1140(-)
MSDLQTDPNIESKFKKAPSLVRPGAQRQRNVKVSWDEAVIKVHDSERGTRQEISEPPTPYHYQDESVMDFEELEEEFGALPAPALRNEEPPVRSRFRSSSSSSDESGPSNESIQREEKEQWKKAKFEALRKLHYNHKLNLEKKKEFEKE